MVFHSESDDGVSLVGDKLYVDGEFASISFYGRPVAATSEFKYLGVMLDRYGSAQSHVDYRTQKAQSAAN
eukprot:6927490-Karenia_brevis.AAC.1